MTTDLEHRPMLRELYQRAEAELLERRTQPPSPAATKSATDTERLLHELQVHQVELEMQNAELVEARERLETLLETYTDLYDFAPVGYFTLAATGTIHLANLTGAQLLGIERSRLVGQPFGLLISPELRPTFQAFLKKVFAGETRQACEVTLLSRGQTQRVVNIRAERLLDGQSCRAVVTDITDRRLVEDKVRVSEVRYRRLFEAAHDGVLILDPATGKITDANPFMTKLLGYSHAQLIGKELFEIGLLKDEAASREMFQKLKRQHEVRYDDLPLESKGGRHQEVEVVANLYQENGHSVIQYNIRDITARKQAEDILHRNQALFSALIEQAPVGVYVVDAQLLLQQINPKARPIFNRIQPLIGRNLADILHHLWPKKVAGKILAHFRHTLKTGQPYESPEFSERRRDTAVTEVSEWQLQRVVMPTGDHGVVCFFNDITERKRTEAAQRRLDLLAVSNRKLESEIVQRRAVEESLRQSEQHQTHLLEQSRQMQEQLRLLSRQVLQAQEEERKRISRELHDVIAQTLTGINVRLASLKQGATLNIKSLERNITRTQHQVEKSVEIVHEFARELRPTVLDDLGLIPALHTFLKDFTTQTGVRTSLTAFAAIEQMDSAKRTVFYRIAQEALTNVTRHAQASRVEVRLQKIPGAARLEIQDDGRSFQVERSLDAKGNKRLGLLGMRERVEMVGGTFGIESAPGHGTTVRVEIPFTTARKAAAKKAKAH